VLHDINLNVKAGEVLAVVDRAARQEHAGAFDSAVLRRQRRQILIDDYDVRDVTLDSLRSQIGIVTQETVLFNDTVRNNIAYGQPHVSQNQVEEAARAAGA